MADEQTERRAHPRFPIHLLALYWGDAQWITGRTVNLSEGGCAVDSDVAAPERTYTAVQLFPPGSETALNINLAVVRWTRNHTFGLEFLHFRPQEYEQWLAFVRSLDTAVRKGA